MVPLQFRGLSYALLAVAVLFLGAAAVIKVLLIKGVLLSNDLANIQREAASAVNERSRDSSSAK
jgi:hypothetical protein